ncbi:putative AC transposase [Glycine soja]
MHLLLKSMAENMQIEEPSSHQPTSQSSDHPTPLSSHQPTPVESSTGTVEGPNNEPMQQPPSMEVDDHGVSSTKTGGGRLKSIVWNHFGRQELTAGGYNEENARKDLACAIIMHEYPLSIVNHVGFRRFLATLQPQFQCPSRNTIKKEIFNVYDFEKSIVMKLLDTNEGRVAITSDMWTASNQKKGYLAVTAHYIDSSWTLQSRILRFIYVPLPHTSERLCNALVECLLDWNIDTKLSTITLDNCSTNDCMIEKIKNKLQLGTLIKEGAFLHMRCCAHILNLIEKDGLGVVKDGVEKIRDSVAYWIATPKRLEKFQDTAKQLIRNLCYDLVSEYQAKKHQDSTSYFESQDVVSDGKSKLCDYDRYIERKKKARTSTMKTELDHYLEEEVLLRSSDFDILMWWKLNKLKYPTLQAIARDVLAIPISTVASESAFSIGGQILTPHRSRLHYTTLKALMCSKSWLWNSENAGSRSIEESTFTDEIESDDEGGSLVSNITQCLQD